MSAFIARSSTPSNQQGFSLIELMIVIAIMAIIVTIASPGIASALERQRNKEAVQTIISAFKEARAESQLRRQDITVSMNGTDIVLSAQMPGQAAATPLKQFSLPAATQLDNTATLTFEANKNVAVNGSNGRLLKVDTFCDKDKTKKGRSVTVDPNGNIQLDTGANQC